MKYAAVTLLVAGIALIAGQQYSVDLSNMRLLQEATEDSTTMAMDDGTSQEPESMVADDPLCNNSVNDPDTGMYTDGSSGSVCTAETGYEACPCYGKLTQEQAEGFMQALGAFAALWLCLIICLPITACCAIGCVVYHCFIKEK